ncbi:CD2 antigen cytoplasmic tail-binding protein 2 [Ciona intestinalis]
MSKRVRFDDNAGSSGSVKVRRQDVASTSKDTNANEELKASTPGSRFKEDHSLDSDEEEEEKVEYEKLTEEDIEGAEDDIDEDEEVGAARITPFNLKEEMEEGDFDTQGHYHFKKEKEIRDNWLDNIDWVKVKKKPSQPEPTNNNDDDDSSDSDNDASQFSELKLIEGIVSLLEKGETVSKGLRRLGGKNNSNKTNKSRSWKREKVYDMEVEEQTEANEDKSDENEKLRNKKFLELTELVDQMTGAGHYDIYSDTFEKLQFRLNSLRVSDKASKEVPPVPTDTTAEDELDIFADDIDEKEGKKKTENGEKSKETTTKADTSIKWEYKWSESTTELFGPFSSQNMEEWKSKGFFNDEVRVRRVDKPNAPFYSAKRVEFDLYD